MKIKWLIIIVLAVLVVPMSGQVVSHPIAEDWESGDFSSLSWERPGLQYRWEITSDGAPTAAFGVLNFPNLGSPMAFVVLDDYLLAGNQYNTTAHSGHRFLGSPFHSDISNDDWIVSPELDFTEPFTFSFFARSFADRFADEKFIAAYSMTDTNANSFIPLHCDSITTIAEWNEYSFMVPAAAKYVAVEQVSDIRRLHPTSAVFPGLLPESLPDRHYFGGHAPSGPAPLHLRHPHQQHVRTAHHEADFPLLVHDARVGNGVLLHDAATGRLHPEQRRHRHRRPAAVGQC